MQEQVNEKSIALTIKTAKLTEKVLERAILAMIAQMKKNNAKNKNIKNHTTNNPGNAVSEYKGKQSVKELTKQGAALSTFEIPDGGVKKFERVAKKYNINFAVKKDASEKDKYIVFFKSKDADSLTAAFNEYNAKIIKKQKPSLKAKLEKNLEKVRESPVIQKTKNKKQELEI